VDAGEDDDPLAAAHDGLDVDSEVLPVLADALEEQPDAVPAVEVAAVGQVVRHAPVDALVEHAQDGGDVGSPERVIHATNDISS